MKPKFTLTMLVIIALAMGALAVVPPAAAAANTPAACAAQVSATRLPLAALPPVMGVLPLAFWWWPPDWFQVPPAPLHRVLTNAWTETKCRAPILFCRDKRQYSDGTVTTHEYPCGVCFDIFGWF